MIYLLRAAVWLYICTKPRKNPHWHAGEHVSKHVCIEQLRACQSTFNHTRTYDKLFLFWCTSYPCQYVNTYCIHIYIYMLIILYLSTFIHAQHRYVCKPVCLPFYNLQTFPWPQTKPVCHGLNSHGAGSPSFRFGRRRLGPAPRRWDVPEGWLSKNDGYEGLNTETFFEGIPCFE